MKKSLLICSLVGLSQVANAADPQILALVMQMQQKFEGIEAKLTEAQVGLAVATDENYRLQQTLRTCQAQLSQQPGSRPGGY